MASKALPRPMRTAGSASKAGDIKKKNAMFQLSIPLALVGILLTLILPIPTHLLDIFLALNITISFIILFVSLFMDKALEFSSFPALLLVTTLFRMAMNVAATRLILLNGEDGYAAAGAVIQAFGEFVVGGNFIIGIVIFFAISMVNLKVITKGSSRIAEVAARFTLDALPGKQIAIDSDLNTGIITEEEAKKRRKELSSEAEFYGAMDGAAKFVTGDAQAGVIIMAINVIGGILIGILQKNMDWMTAAQTYTILTIGEGLVAQIPSIVISTASGLIVARAASGEDLGTEVITQLTKYNRPLFITSGVAFAMAIVPGLPFIPFMVLSTITGVLGYISNETAKKEDKKTADGQPLEPEKQKGPPPGSTEEVTGLLALDTLELEVGYELVCLVDGGKDSDLIERIRSIRRQFALDYGFVVPPIHIRDNVRLKSNEYRCLLRGSEIGRGKLRPNHLLAMDPGNVSTPIKGEATKEPAFGLDALWIPQTDKEKAQFSGYTVVDLSTVVTTHLTELVRVHAHELLGRQETQSLLDNLAKDYPKIVEELVPTVLTLGQVQQVLKHLLREQVSVRDLKTILETLADWGVSIKQPEKLSEMVRRKLSRIITAKYLSKEGTLTLVSFTPNLEQALVDCVQQTDEGSVLAMEPSHAQILISKLNRAAEKFVEMGETPLLLATPHLRAAIFKFCDRFVPGWAVISHQEIAPSTKVRSLGVVAIDEI